MEKNKIRVQYGADAEQMAGALVQASSLAERIGDRDKKIGLKPNLVLPAPAAEGATTHPGVARGVLAYLRENGFKNLFIIEGAWVGARTERAFEVCGYRALAKEFGATLIDTQKDSHTRCNCAGLEIDICDTALGMDFMINLPVMKGHCQTRLTCALKNNKGLIPNAEKRRFHTLGLHRPIAHLNTVVHSDFVLVDALCGDLDFEEGGNPVPTGMLFAGQDPVLCDAFAAAQLGYRPEEIPYLPLAAALGVGSMDLAGARVEELNQSSEAGGEAAKAARAGQKVRRLEKYVHQQDACSACYSALVRALSRLEEDELARLPGRVCVGQAFKNQKGDVGAGNCTAGFAHMAPGCPPAAVDVLSALRGALK